MKCFKRDTAAVSVVVCRIGIAYEGSSESSFRGASVLCGVYLKQSMSFPDSAVQYFVSMLLTASLSLFANQLGACMGVITQTVSVC